MKNNKPSKPTSDERASIYTVSMSERVVLTINLPARNESEAIAIARMIEKWDDRWKEQLRAVPDEYRVEDVEHWPFPRNREE